MSLVSLLNLKLGFLMLILGQIRNSVGAAQLNGALNDNSGVQYPLEFDDEFDILLTIQSAIGQLDVSGDPLTMNRTALLKMQITE